MTYTHTPVTLDRDRQTDKYLFLGRHPTVESIVGGSSSMDDPELHGDEQILMRTQGVHVKSISFEAILTNKRIILVDRLKGILPPKEIPLATIQSVESGENAIRDLVITLGVITKTGGTRQMVLTFSREGGGTGLRNGTNGSGRSRLTILFHLSR